MQKNLSAVDTNVLVRFLVGDNKVQLRRVKKLLKNSEHESLFLSDVVITEVVYVLESNYGFEKSEIGKKLGTLVSTQYFGVNLAKIPGSPG